MENWITGMGMVASVGHTLDECFNAFCRGESGNKSLQAFPRERFNVGKAYEIDDRPDKGGDTPGRATKWLVRAIGQALTAAGLRAGQGRVAVLVGTGLRELRSLELWWVEGQPMHVSELHFGGAIRKSTGMRVPVMTFSNACAASNFMLGLADDMLRLGDYDAVVVSGCDSITESMFGLLDRVNPLHPEQVQPFDRNRKGVLMGEGAAALVLENPDHARLRSKGPMALLRSVGMSCDAFHETQPAMEGIQRAMTDAYDRARVEPAQIGLMMVHGTGTAANDMTEAKAIVGLMGQAGGGVMISGLKSMTGHTSGASGLVGVVTAVKAMERGLVPPTLGFNEPLAEAPGLDVVHGKAREARVNLAQVNAFGFGGVNAVAILERSEP
ncbi:MAG TPA: beta-ketoacyl-[acyl-carrier-protein] synthase family protein [Fibrobacteria bacterium]|nr:beta-ketoacyl-[acyl-carrier-protein] synthase family protein [Fibrobacteria bacterium]